MQLPDARISWAAERAQVAASGELGYTSGSSHPDLHRTRRQDGDRDGKYLEVWKKVDGQWKCLSDAYNSSLPLPSLKPAAATRAPARPSQVASPGPRFG